MPQRANAFLFARILKDPRTKYSVPAQGRQVTSQLLLAVSSAQDYELQVISIARLKCAGNIPFFIFNSSVSDPVSPSQLDGGKFHLVIPGAPFPRVTSEFRDFVQGMPGCPWAGSGGTYWSLQISPERLTAPASMALWNQTLHAKTVPHTGQGTLYLRLLKGPCAWDLHTAILWGVTFPG